MDAAILIGIGAILAGWAWKAGKREGSKKAYHVGRQHERRQGKS